MDAKTSSIKIITSTLSAARATSAVKLFPLILAVIVLLFIPLTSLAADPGSPILQDLHSFAVFGTVLHIAAHPDDENTQLIAYLARGRDYRTGYLSVTRGDGGQNLLGPEFGDLLGVIRTQELLSARRVDGGRQFFTRAKDFGYSKDYQQTLTKWNRDEVVSDIVRVIREFRPDILITRFSPMPGNTHGHHTASAVLALQAFKLAGDPKAFPDQLTTLQPWQPKRIFMNSGAPGGVGNGANVIRIDIGGTDPLTGKSFAAVAAQSRSMHKTQGFGGFAGRGGSGPHMEAFALMDGEPATKDIMDGIDTTWNRVAGGAEIARLTDQAISAFDPKDAAASVPALLEIRTRVLALPSDPIVTEKQHLLDRIIAACVGLEIQTTVANSEIVPGEALAMHHTAIIHSNTPVQWLGLQYPSLTGSSQNLNSPIDLKPNEVATRDVTETLPANTLLTQPYWLREDGTAGMFRVDDASLIGRPENPPVFPISDNFQIGGQTITIDDEPVQIITAANKPETRRRLDAIPPVTLSYTSDVQLFAPGATKTVQVNVTAFRDNAAGTVELDAPADWKISPASREFRLPKSGYQAGFEFTITAPAQPESAAITAAAVVNGIRYSNQRIEIGYDHIPRQLLQPPARLKAVCLDLAIAGHKVGYLPGAGDSIEQSLQQMGYDVTPLTGADLTADKLKDLDAVVVGIRALNVRTDLAAHLPALFAYVQGGGTVVEQYNTPNGLQTPTLAPFSITLSGNLPNHRVTDEKSKITLLAPDHPAFNTPNKIAPADFDGWVQERGLNFPDQWDQQNFTALLACSDVGEAPLTSGLLVAKYGKGYFVYTGLSFFRQLPAGVPGAYRLFANLVSLGK